MFCRSTILLFAGSYPPAAILLAVPLAMVGALGLCLVMAEPLSLYGQIGLVLLVGLAAKSAILIVEFAKSLRERERLGLHEASVKAARLRFRPVMMTGLSFAAGVFPLVLASGAGAASRISLGVAVFGGTLMSVAAGTLPVPVFFRVVQGLRERFHRGPTRPPGGQAPS